MAERDPSELDLAAAFRLYLEEAPTEVRPTELARHFATDYPQGRTSIGPWRFAAVPRLAWLALLAGLLAALLGGALLVGSQMQRRLPAVVPPVGQVFECPPGSTPDEPGPVDQPRPTVLPDMTFDREAGRLVGLADGGIGEAETWTFDVCTNTWTRMHPNREPPTGTGWLVYDVDSDVTIASDGIWTWVYDLKANTWTKKGDEPSIDDVSDIRFYDPVSGRVVALGPDPYDDTLGLEPWGYEVETDTWTPIPQAEPPVVGDHNERFAYDASVDRLVAYAKSWGPAGDAEARTWLFDLRTGIWSETGAVTPGFSFGIWGVGPSIAYDEAAERTVMLGQGHSAAYDATADRWETRYGWSTSEDWQVACGTRPECRVQPSMVYDPVNERLVVYGAVAEVVPDDLLAFDTRTGEWTVLLAASAARPAP